MKRSSVFLLVTALLVLLASSFPTALAASARHPKTSQATFEGSPAWQKLDLRLREAWRASAGNEAAGKRVLECLLKATRAPSADDQAMLKAAGFEARTFIGTIVTGGVPARRVPDVAALPFVSAMELAVPLELKKKP